MKVTIMQPSYLPWWYYFERIYYSDTVVFLDDVQFERRGFNHRNKLSNQNGNFWLTIPIKKKNNFQLNINEIEIKNEVKWKKKHQQSIILNYKKAKFFHKLNNLIKIYDSDYDKLIDILKLTNKFFLNILSIKKKINFSSKIKKKGKKSDLILSICEELGATEYITGPMGASYINKNQFLSKNIELIMHQNSKKYADLSMIHYICHYGVEDIKKKFTKDNFIIVK